MSLLNYYLTSLEPGIAQQIPSQSIGGYCSTSLLYPQTNLSENIGMYGTSFSIEVPEEGWGRWGGVDYIVINNELIKISGISVAGVVSVEERGVNSLYGMHLLGDVVRGINTNLLNDVFDLNRSQYRCLAVKNETDLVDPSNSILSNIRIFLKQNSRNSKCNIELSIEMPDSQYLSSMSTSRTEMTLTDSSLIGLYEDNYFAEAFIKPSGTEGGIVQSFDSATGTFTYYSSFSTGISNVAYEVFPAPSERIKTGIESPSLTFSSPSIDSPIYIDEVGVPFAMNPNDIFYIWIKRTLDKGAENMSADDFVISIAHN